MSTVTTYSTSLRLTLMGDGTNSGTWGQVTNTNLGSLLDQAIAGIVTVPLTQGVNTTLTANEGSIDQSRAAYLIFTGALTTSNTVIAPSTSVDTGLPVTKMYTLKNSTTGGQSVVFRTVNNGASITIPNGATIMVWSDGTNIVNAVTYLPAITSTALTNSTIDSSPIGSTTPSSGTFTTGSFQSLNIATGGTLSNVVLNNASGTMTTVTVGTATVNGGTINSTTIGATSPSTGAFTTLTCTVGSLNATIGATSPYSGAFTTLSSSGVYTNTVADGSSPMAITSTTRVSNLNVARSGFADTTTISAVTANATYYPVLAAASNGQQASNVNTNYTFNPSTGALSITGAFASGSLTPTTPLGVAYGGTGNANGFIAPRVVTVASATSITPNANTTDELYQQNSQAGGTLTINAPTGSPVDGQKLIFRLNCTNAQTLSFNAIYTSSSSLGFPSSTTGSSKTDYLGFIYNAATSKWNYVAQVLGF